MRIKVDKTDKGKFQADCTNLPGSPPLGFGDTEQEAVINLLHILLSRQGHPYNSTIEYVRTYDG